jgi:hypothetical protein
VRSEDTSPVEWHTPLTHMQAAQDGFGQFPNLWLGVEMIQREERWAMPEHQEPCPDPKQQQAEAIHLKKGMDAFRPSKTRNSLPSLSSLSTLLLE